MSENDPAETKPRSTLQNQYEPRLWQRAEDLMAIRTPLEKHSAELFNEVAAMRGRPLNLHERDVVLAKIEQDYWRTKEKIEEIQKQENQIEKALTDLDAGLISQETLQQLLPAEEEPNDQLSKRRQRMLEEQQRLGLDSREGVWDYYREFGIFPPSHVEYGSDPTRLTTGRHQKEVHGNLSATTAEDEFFFRTTDTHGGKVPHGKTGDSYTTASGKRVRKH